MTDTVFTLHNFRYLKVAFVLIVISIGMYIFHTPLGQPNGGTWVGFTLGIFGALLIVWLAWFGIRKRRYGLGKMTLQEWLSAHVYLGLSLIVIATLHTGFQVGWNVHTLSYVLMLVVIFSGLYGIYLYVQLPHAMTRNRGGLTLEEIMGSISEMDRDCQAYAIKLGDEINDLAREAAENTGIGGSPLRQLSGVDPNCPTARALERTRDLTKSLTGEEAGVARDLVLMLARKNELLQTARRDVKYRAWLNVWLIVHVPLSIALLITLVIHIVSVFYYR